VSLDIDYYELLECERTADDKTLKSAYRSMAMKFHPDRNPGDAEAEARFKAINEAYDVLKDPQKRAAYDQYGKALAVAVVPAEVGLAFPTSPIFSKAFLAMPLAAVGNAGQHAVPIYAMIWKSAWMMLFMAVPLKLPSMSRPVAAIAVAQARNQAPDHAVAICAAGMAKCARSRAFSLSNALAQPAMAAAK
jgi:DnaJ domain